MTPHTAQQNVQGQVYAIELQEAVNASRDTKGQHANGLPVRMDAQGMVYV